MRVLIITFSYRPLNNPRAFRWTVLSEALVKHGHDIDIITSCIPGESEVEMSGGLTIYRVGWKPIERLRDKIRQKRASIGSANFTADKQDKNQISVKKWLSTQFIRLWRALHWPDASCLWYFPAKSAGKKLLKKNQYDVILSVAPSFTSVVVGRALSKYQVKARWVLDLGDPFSFLEGAPPNNQKLYASVNRRYERRAFTEASKVSVTNLQTKMHYEAIFPEAKGKIQVIPPLLSLPPAALLETVPGMLVYIGTLYKNIREPVYLLELFESAIKCGLNPNVELHFIGDISACIDQINPYKIRLGKRIVLHGLVDREVVGNVMAKADILINIGNDTTYQLPSKVVEYLASGKRILNLAKSQQDSSTLFFANYPLALSLISVSQLPNMHDVQHFVNFVQEKKGCVNDGYLNELIMPYQLPNILKEYLDILGDKHE